MIIHTVSQAETLNNIAKSYAVSPKRIILDNGLRPPFDLCIGQSLIILKPSVTYKAKKNDTLYKISRMFDTSVIRLIMNNPTFIYNPTLYTDENITIEFDNQSGNALEVYGYVYPFVNKDLLTLQAAFSTAIGIFSYGFTKEGNIIPINDDPILDILKAWQTKAYLVLTSINETGKFDANKASILFNNKNLQDKVIEKIQKIMIQKGYRGIDLDFEFIEPDDKEAYIDFANKVKEKMSELSFLVNIDLAPKTSDTQRGTLYEGHDYKALGEIADSVLLMTYEWGYTYGPPMAVAPLDKVKEVVDYATRRIDSTKIYMGIPNYGYDWPLPYVKGSTKARSIGNEEALSIAIKYGANINFASPQASPYFNYTDNNGHEHIVWFEDVRSIEAKYKLIDDYRLKGSGYWNLMRSFMQNWSYTNSQFLIEKH